MNRSVWLLLCMTLPAAAAVHAQAIGEETGEPRDGRHFSERTVDAVQSQPAVPVPQPASPSRQTSPVPANRTAAPTVPTPSVPSVPSVPRTPVPQSGAASGQRSVERPSDPSQGHWSTQSSASRGTDNSARETGRNDSRRDDTRRDDARRADERRDDDRSAWSRYDWQRSERSESLRRSYQWRDYDRYRADHFRFDSGRYFGRSRYYGGAYVWPRGFAVRIWLIGEWLPSVFMFDSRYLLDYRRFGLYEPPLGCRWVRVGDDALLVDSFNGEVLDAIYALFW